MRRRTTGAALAILAGVALAGCTQPTDQPGPPASPEPQPTQTGASASPSGSGSPSSSPATGGSVQPTTDLLSWSPVAGSVDTSITTDGEWTLAVNKAGTRADLTGPRTLRGYQAQASGKVSDALLDDDWAVVVRQDPTEQDPATAQVVNLDSGRTFTLDGSSDVPTTSGGTWALGDDQIVYATMNSGNYCLAQFSLESGQASVAYCAAQGSGFNSAHVFDGIVSVLAFDNERISCRTVVRVAGGMAAPYDGPADCKAGEGLVLDGDSGEESTVWSEIPNENRFDSARFHARSGGASYDLGPGVTGTLTACGDAAYFVRPSTTDSGPAALMRWDGSSLAVVFESKAGPAFLGDPRCAGDHLTITSLAEGGDQQVTTEVES